MNPQTKAMVERACECLDDPILISHRGIGSGSKLIPQQDQKGPEGVWPSSQAFWLGDSQEARVFLRLTQAAHCWLG